MNIFWYLVALAAGMGISTQVAVNNHLRSFTAHPMQATLISFTVGTLATLAYCLVARDPQPRWTELIQQPWWVWTGGLLGVLWIWTSVVVTPHVGILAILCLSLAGQMVASCLIDQFGLFQSQVKPMNLGRVAGIALVLVGATVVALSRD